MDPAPIVILVAGGIFAIGSLVTLWRNPKARAQRLLKRCRESRPAEIADGELVRVRGITMADKIITAPLTGMECIGFRVIVEKHEDGGWSAIERREQCLPFMLVADGIELHVEGPFLLASLDVDARCDNTDREFSPTEAKVLQELGVTVHGGWFQPHLRLHEAVLARNDVVWVAGLSSVAVDPRGQQETLRGQPIRRIIRGTERAPTVLADEIRD